MGLTMIISQKKRDINVQAGSDWAIFGKISDALTLSTGGAVLYEWILFVLLFGGLDITKTTWVCLAEK